MSQSQLAREFISLIERRGLLDQEIVLALRQQIDESGARITPEAVAKLLVDNGHLTRFQATKLIGDLRSNDYPDDDGDAGADAAVIEPVGDSGDDLLPSDGFEDVVEVEAVDVDAIEVEAIDVEAIDAEAVEVEAIEVDAIDDDAGLVEVEAVEVESGRQSSGGGRTSRTGQRRSPRSEAARARAAERKSEKQEPKSKWDTFKIYGVFGLIMILIPPAIFLYSHFRSGQAAEYMEQAQTKYQQQGYKAAQGLYSDYLDIYDDTDDASKARVRIVMCELYQTFSNSTDPEKFLDAANTMLPPIVDEPALGEDRDDLAGLLVEVAEKMVAMADRSRDPVAKEKLIGQLDQLMELINEPSYVTTQMRDTLGKKLELLAEDRQRVIRDISRDVKLAETIASMKKSLEAKETHPAYLARKQIVAEYPRLQDDPTMNDLVQQACTIQKERVSTGVTEFDVSTDELATTIRKAIVLANRTGQTLNELGDAVFFGRVGGSILALRAADGALLWRRYVGNRDQHPPTPLGNSPLDGVLLSDGSQLEVQNLGGGDGSLVWRTAIKETFTQPMVAGDTVVFSTHSGKVASLDVETGETNWVSQVPQSLEVSPGTVSEKGVSVSYVPGDHSNLYVLDHRTGKCEQCLYLGHQEKTVRVPPMYLLNHVFVFENKASDYCMMHILETDKQGLGLKQSQSSIRLEGNVRVSPQIVQRRMIVVTDLGEISVFEVEPTAETNKVSKVAGQVPSYTRPTLTRLEVDRSQMWVTGTQIMRYELQMNTGSVIQGEVHHEGDVFVSRPKLFGNVLLHARVVAGSRGVRVAAVDPKTMKTLWQTDLGVPVSMVAQYEKNLHAISSQGALYEIDSESIASGATKRPVENPGGEGHFMQFESPVPIDAKRSIMPNKSFADQIAVYEPEREKQKLRIIKLAIPKGKLTASPLVNGDRVLIPLDTGSIAMLDWKTGKLLTNPFQPSLAPGEKVQWTQMAMLAGEGATAGGDGQMVVGDSRKKLYRVRVGEAFRQLADATVERPFLGPMLALNDKLMAIGTGPSADMMLTFDGISLASESESLLGGRVLWGPEKAGSLALVATDDDVLQAFDSEGTIVWKTPLPPSPPVGGALVVGNALILVGQSGWVLHLDAPSGQPKGLSDIGQPLSSSPIAYGRVLIVPGSEGVVFAMDVPTSYTAPAPREKSPPPPPEPEQEKLDGQVPDANATQDKGAQEPPSDAAAPSDGATPSEASGARIGRFEYVSQLAHVVVTKRSIAA